MQADHNCRRREIALITADIGWGSASKAAERAPQALLDAGLAERLNAVIVRVPANPKMSEVSPSYEAVEKIITEHICQVADAVHQAVHQGFFPVVIGGDHTSAVGFHAGLGRAYGRLGIIWVDTHPDLNTVSTSPSGRIHGMVLAALLGRGSEVMLEAAQSCLTKDQQVAMIGIRDIDQGELKWIEEGNINCMTMNDVREDGLHESFIRAVKTACHQTDGFGLTVDLDAIDPVEAPFVSTPVKGGIKVNELLNELSELSANRRLKGLEVAECTPRSVEDNDPACDLVYRIINAVTST